jgi:hypothetical protein
MVPGMVDTTCVGLVVYGLGNEQSGMRAIPLVPPSVGMKMARRTASPIDALLDGLEATNGRIMRTRAI